MFVLFHGILGMVTPPVALAAFAAATIAKSDQWKTGWTATRMSWCAYLIPFMFAYSPALIMRGGARHGGAARSATRCSASSSAPWRWSAISRRRSRRPTASPICMIAVMVLVPSNAFAGGSYVAIAGVVLALAAIAREVMRGPRRRSWRDRADLNINDERS